MSPHSPMPGGGGHVDRPVAGTTDVRSTTPLHILEGTSLHDRRSRFSGLDESVARRLGCVGSQKFVIQPFVIKVSLFVSDPFLQSPMRLNTELAHKDTSCSKLSWAHNILGHNISTRKQKRPTGKKPIGPVNYASKLPTRAESTGISLNAPLFHGHQTLSTAGNASMDLRDDLARRDHGDGPSLKQGAKLAKEFF